MPRLRPGPKPARTVLVDGERLPLRDAAERAGLPRCVVYTRWDAGDRTAERLLRPSHKGPRTKRALATRMREDGHSPSEIAEALGVTVGFVTSAIHSAGGVWLVEAPAWAIASLLHSVETGTPVDGRAADALGRALMRDA